MLLTYPPRSMFVNYIGMYWLASGLTSIGWGLRGAKRKGLWFAAGLIGFLGGMSVITRQLYGGYVSPTVAINMFGVVAILSGLMHIFGGFRKADDMERAWSWESFILGITEVGLGILVIVMGGELRPAVRVAAVIWALVGGTGLLLQALNLRKKYLNHLHYGGVRSPIDK